MGPSTPKNSENVLTNPVMMSTARRRMTRMQVIEETDEVLTPVSNIANKIQNTNIQEAAAFKTPKSSRISQVRGMKVESPLASVNSTRGSSKRKRTSPDSKNSVAALFDNLEGSPLLAKLEAKIKSNQEITEDDFVSENNLAPVAKQLKLDQDFNSIAAEAEERKEDVPYFRNLLKTETERLTAVCEDWEEKLEADKASIDEDIQGEIRSVIGQARLVMTERFHQFSGLVDNCEFKRGEKETTCTDLMGFWEMIYFQVEDVEKKFGKLLEIE